MVCPATLVHLYSPGACCNEREFRLAATIRITSKSQRVLEQIAGVTGNSIQEELDRAIEERRRKVYLQGLAKDYAALKKNKKAWQELQAEHALWDTTTSDGAAEL